MFVLCPMSNCGSPQKRDRFVEHLSKIAPVTLDTEPQCAAYAWFRSAEDNDEVPHHWLRGFEVYDTVEANTVAHRASAPYKTFRAAVAEEKLLDRPSDLRYWRPTAIGFLARPGTTSSMKGGAPAECQYVVVHELTPRAGAKGDVLAKLRDVADLANVHDSALSFLVLDRGEGDEDEGLYVFSLFESKSKAVDFEATTDEIWARVAERCEWNRRTTWVTCGVGFIGRA